MLTSESVIKNNITMMSYDGLPVMFATAAFEIKFCQLISRFYLCEVWLQIRNLFFLN